MPIENITSFLEISEDFQLKNLWELQISRLFGKEGKVEVTGFDEDRFKYKVKNVSFNIRKLRTETSYQGMNFYVGEEESENTLTFEMYEYADMSTLDYLMKWRNTIFKSYYDKTGRSFLVFNSFYSEDDYMNNCLRTFTLTFQAPEEIARKRNIHNKMPAYSLENNISINFYNVKLIGFDNVSLSYEDGQPLTYSVTVQYDYYDMENVKLKTTFGVQRKINEHIYKTEKEYKKK